MSAAFDSDAWRAERDERLRAWLLGDAAAIEIVHVLGEAMETWDDLVDGDVAVDAERVSAVFTGLLVRLEANPCWQRTRALLWPVVVLAINGWLDSEALRQRPEPRLRELAFHLRNTATEIVPMLAFAVGGWDHLRRISPELRAFFHHERYADWEHAL